MSTSTTHPTTPRDRTERASVLPAVPGVPWWGAVLIALAGTAAGAFLDRGQGATGLSTGTIAGFYIGVVLAVLAVRRRALFTTMVQPPLIFAVVAVGMLRFVWGLLWRPVAFALVDFFPTMAIGTGAALLLGLIRLLAQPLRGSTEISATPVHR